MDKKSITEEELKKALLKTFEHYWSYQSLTDYDVFVGVTQFFCPSLWNNLKKAGELIGEKGDFGNPPKNCKHEDKVEKEKEKIITEAQRPFFRIFGKFYYKKT